MLDRTIFDFPYKVSTYLGLWGPRGHNEFIKKWYWVYQTWTYSFLTIFTSCCVVDLYNFRKDVQKVSTNLTATVTAIMLIYKNSIALCKFTLIEAHQKKLQKGLFSKADYENQKAILRGIHEMKMSCYTVYGLSGVAISCWLVLPFIFGTQKHDRALPIPVWIPWNFEKSPYFELTFLYQAYGAYLISINALSFNLSVFGTIIQICSEYDVLSVNLLKIGKWYDDLIGDVPRKLTKEENSTVEKMLIEKVQHHQKIIRSVNDIENFYIHVMVVQLMGSAGLCVVVCLDLILAIRMSDSRVITLVAMFILVSTDVALFCHFGSRLKHKGLDFLKCTYSIPWEAMDNKNRKTVSIIIMKAQRIPVMTIEKFATIDLVALVSMTKIIYNIIYLVLYVTESN